MIQDFITSQLLDDNQWQLALKQGFHLPACPQEPHERLRELIKLGMEKEMEEVKHLADNNEPPTFDNTIVALERAGGELARATTVMYNLLDAETNDDLDQLAEEMAPLLSEHGNNIMMNEKLFARVKAVFDNPPTGLTSEDRMLLEKTYEGFERSGATLDEEGKKRFREISRELSAATLRFSNHLLKDTNAFTLHLTDEQELAGIPEMHRKTAAQEAADRGMEGWLFTLHAPSFIPFMTYAARRDLREKMYRAYHSRCTHQDEQNNFQTVRDLVNLRRERAALLGYPHYAAYALRRRMAGKTEKVYDLLHELTDSYLPEARKEVRAVAEKAQALEGKDFVLMPWDFAYYSQMLRKELFDYDPDMLRPYFELGSVKKGVFGLATRLYGITFEEDKSIPVYHPDVTAYRVCDKDGQLLAVLLTDFFPRSGKQGGAWMTNYRGEHCDLPTHEAVTASNSFRPVVSITTNFTKPAAGTPALLSLGEVETFLHEFGHALHGIFAMTHYEALSGTSVYWDFVELPSQFMENYATEPEFLHTFARHYQTGEPLPQEYIDRIRRAQTFQAAYQCIRQVSFGLLDMACYTLQQPFPEDVKAFEEQAWESVRLMPQVEDTCMAVQFSHIMSGGYAAGYYSYKWAEVLDADAFAMFREEGIFNEETARRFRTCILAPGGTVHPMGLYLRFRGREPRIDALLQRDGLTSNREERPAQSC